MKLDKEKILEYQKNRPPYLMIDFVNEVIPGKTSNGFKKLNDDEWFFKVHWENDPNMPGMLQIESLVQMCSMAIHLQKQQMKMILFQIFRVLFQLKTRML